MCPGIGGKAGQEIFNNDFSGIIFHQSGDRALAVQLAVRQDFGVLPAADALVPSRKCTVHRRKEDE